MKKKILGVFVSLFVIVMLANTVMAAPPTKIEGVTATFVTISNTGPPRWVDTGIMKIKMVYVGTVTLNIPGVGILIGDYNAEWHGQVKFTQSPPDPEAQGVNMGRVIWTFTGGTFEGTRHIKSEGMPNSNIRNIIVLHGTGDFLGQTLKLSYDGPPPLALEGTLLIPK